MEEHELPERLRGLGIKKHIPGEKVAIVLSEKTIEALVPLVMTQAVDEKGD